MTPKLHGSIFSPAVRSSLLTIKALGLEVEFNEVNTRTGDHLTPTFLKLNPLHTIPTLEDGELVVWDSHAIDAYLVGKYGKDDSLYPKDLGKRAIVDQRLHFDCGVLFVRMRTVVLPLFKEGATSLNKEAADLLSEAYGQLELLLEKGPYVTGESLTIADFSLVATVTSADVLVPISSNKFPKVTAWISKMQALPYYAEANQKGLDKFTELIKSKLA